MNPHDNEPLDRPAERGIPTKFRSSNVEDLPTLHPGNPELKGRIPETVGKFKILKIIGEGGMGVVGLGTELEGRGEQRQVAVKLLKRDVGGSAFEARVFDQECRSLARFNHDNIARLIDFGHHEGNLRLPYIVMEYVEQAVRITDYCCGLSKNDPEKPLSLRNRLELFLRACAGIRHAHERNVIHRDISAKNVLVGLVDKKPVVKIIDFGISLHGETRRNTADGATAGTPSYMSPEQLSGDAALVDQRSDVYSLGILLCELLVGRRPYEFHTTEEAKTSLHNLESKGTTAVVPSRLARELSTATRQGGGIPGLTPGFWQRLAKELQGDLDAIVAKATALNADERYSSVTALVEDIENYLSGHALVHARTPSLAVRSIKFIQRNALGVAASVAILILLLGLLAYGIHDYRKTLASNTIIQRQSDDLAKVNINLRGQGERLWREQQRAYSSTLASFPVMLAQGKTAEARAVLAATRNFAEKGWEWSHLLSVSDQSDMVLGYSEQGFRHVMAAGAGICAVASDHSVWFWKADDGRFLKSNARHRFPVIACVFNQTSCHTFDASGCLMSWSTQDGAHKREIRLVFPDHDGPDGVDAITGAAFDASFKHLLIHWRSVTGSRLGLFGTADGKPLSQPVEVAPLCAFCWRENEVVQAVELPAGETEMICRTWQVQSPHGSLTPIAASPLPVPDEFSEQPPLEVISIEGREFVRFESGFLMARWDQGRLETKSHLRVPVTALSINRKGSGGVLGLKDGSIYRFDCSKGQIFVQADGSGNAIGRWCGHLGAINDLALTSDEDARLLSASSDGSIRAWSLDRVQPSRLLSNLRALLDYWQGLSEASQAAVGLPLMTRLQASSTSWCKIIEKDGIQSVLSISDVPPFILRTCCNDLATESCHLPDSSPVPAFLTTGTDTDLRNAPNVVTAGSGDNGQFLAILRAHPVTGELDIVAGNLLASTPTFWTSSRYPMPAIEKLAVSPDGQWLVANRLNPASKQEELVLWNFSTNTAHPEENVLNHTDASVGTVSAIEFSSAGDWLLVGNTSGRLLVWKKTGGERPPTPEGSFQLDGSVRCLAVSPESSGRRKVAVALADDSQSQGGGLGLGFDIKSRGFAFLELAHDGLHGKPYIPSEPLELKKLCQDLAWNANGTRLASADSDGRLRIWSFREDPSGLQLQECRLVLVLDDPYRSDDANPLRTVSWSADDRWLAASNAADGCFIYQDRSNEKRFRSQRIQLEVDQARDRVPSTAELQFRGRSVRELQVPDTESELSAVLARVGTHPDQVTQWAWSALSKMKQLPVGDITGPHAEERQSYLNALLKDVADVDNPKRKLAVALAHFRLGEFNKARAVLSGSDASSEKAHSHLLALIEAQSGDFKRALQLRAGAPQFQRDPETALLQSELEQVIQAKMNADVSAQPN